MQRIIYKNLDNTIVIIIPTPEALAQFGIEFIAQKDVPQGLEYKIVDTASIPSDRVFRDAWEFDGTSISENESKAQEIAKKHIRAYREKEFAKNDIVLQNAIADNDNIAKASAISRRNELRDMPSQCDGKSVVQLKELLNCLECK